MKDPKYQQTIFDEEGEALIRQQLLDSYYEGTTETKQRHELDGQEDEQKEIPWYIKNAKVFSTVIENHSYF